MGRSLAVDERRCKDSPFLIRYPKRSSHDGDERAEGGFLPALKVGEIIVKLVRWLGIKQTSTKGRLDINKLKLVETNVRLREETENPG